MNLKQSRVVNNALLIVLFILGLLFLLFNPGCHSDDTSTPNDPDKSSENKLKSDDSVVSCEENCADGYRCFDGKCVVELCDESTPCSEGGFCYDGACCYGEECDTTCDSEDCAVNTNDKTCVNDATCGNNERCSNGNCVVDLCDESTPCSDGGLCYDGACCYGDECESPCDSEDCR